MKMLRSQAITLWVPIFIILLASIAVLFYFTIGGLDPLSLVLFLLFCTISALSLLLLFFCGRTIASLHHDLSALNDSHKNLKTLKEKLMVVIDRVPQGVLIFSDVSDSEQDVNLELSMTNARSGILLERNVEDKLGKSIKEVLPKTEISENHEQYQQVSIKGNPFYNTYFSAEHNKWFRSTAEKVEEGIVVHFSDITVQKKAEHELTETKLFLDHVINASHDIVSIINIKENKISYINNKVHKLLGYAPEEIYAMDETDIEQLIHPADRHKRKRHFGQCLLLPDNEAAETEYRIKDIHGTWKKFHFTLKVFKRDKKNIPVELIEIGKDISDKKEREIAIDRKNEELLYAYDELKKVKEYLVSVDKELEKKVSERTRILVSQNLDLRKTNESLDSVATMASHDLKGVLTNLTLLTNYFENTTQYGKKVPLVHAIRSSVNALNNIIKGLTTVVKAQRIQNHITKELTFYAILAPILEKKKSKLQEHKGQTFLDFSKCPKIRYTEDHLKAIFENLISCALQYAHDKRDLQINISTEEDQNHVVLRLSDNGVGIDLNQYAADIYIPFKRISEKGGGVELHLLKNIVEKKGGSISVESEINKGTTFTCRLRKHVPI